MRTVINYVVVAVILGGVAAVALTASRIERRVARAEQQMATLELDAPDTTYAELSEYLDFAESMPWLFGDTRADLAARRVTLRYWRGEFAGILADYADTTSAEVTGNLPLQFIVANAAYRAGVNAEAEREEVLRAIDGAIGVYLGVLQESPDHPDAAYNYEYLIRLRADIAAGADIPMGSVNPNGREGESPEDGALEEIKIYVPVQQDVDPEMDESPTLGAGQGIRKRG